MVELSPEILELMRNAVQTEQSPGVTALPDKFYKVAQERERKDKALQRLRALSKGMAAAPALGAITEMSALRGGSGINLNPALAWASGLPGAPKNLAAISQSNPYIRPSEALKNLMAMGESASSATSRYLQARDRFRSQQGLTSPTSKMSPVEMLLFRDMVNQGRERRAEERQLEKDQRAAELQLAKERRAEERQLERERRDRQRDLEDKARRMSLDEQKLAYDAYSHWSDKNYKFKKALAEAASAAQDIKESYSKNPKDLYYDINGFKLNKKSFPDFLNSPESRRFYRAMKAFVQPIIREKIGSQQTVNEAKKMDAALGFKNFSDFEQLIQAYNNTLNYLSESYKDTLGPLRATPRGLAYDLWHINEKDYSKILKDYMLKSESKRSGGGRKTRGRSLAPSTEGSRAADSLLEDIMDL